MRELQIRLQALVGSLQIRLQALVGSCMLDSKCDDIYGIYISMIVSQYAGTRNVVQWYIGVSLAILTLLDFL